VYPPGLTLASGDGAQLIHYNDQDFGFLRLTLDANEQTLHGEFFAAYNSEDTGLLPALRDAFTVDLRMHKVE
jgi:hypothetical protein